jgi:hypothetical protein
MKAVRAPPYSILLLLNVNLAWRNFVLKPHDQNNEARKMRIGACHAKNTAR